MKEIPVVKSKLIIPQQTEPFIFSERLKKLCKSMYEHNVVTVTAPAGYGKTALLVAAANMYGQSNCKICWYRLDSRDRNLVVFYFHLFEALSAYTEINVEEMADSLSDDENAHADLQHLNALVIRGLWNIQQCKKNQKTFIVLEDYHEVAGVEEITLSLRYIIDNLPPQCVLIISSRVEAELVTVKQSLDKKVLKVGWEALRFSEDETAAYIKGISGAKAEHSLLHEILYKTEGWVTGVVILYRALKKSDVNQKGAYKSNTGKNDEFTKYFSMELLQSVKPDLLQFIVKSSLMKDFTVGEASCITGILEVRQYIETCEKGGMFIEKTMEDERNILYRFHGIFREVLIQLQPRYFSKQEAENCLLRVGDYNVEHHSYNRAIEYYIIGGHVLKAVDLIMKESANLITLEAFEQLRICFRLLPDDIVKKNATLMLIKSYMYQQGENDIAILSKKALACFRTDQNFSMQIKVLMSMAAFSQFRNDSCGAVRALKQVAALAKQDESLSGGVVQMATLMREIWEEKYIQAARTCKKINILQLDEEWKWVANLYSCMLNILTGDQKAALIYINEGLELNLVKKTKILMAFSLLFKAFACFLQDDRNMLAEVKNGFVAIGEKYNIAYLLAFGHWLSAMESYRDHSLEAAMEHMEASAVHFEQLGNKGMLGLTRLTLCLWHVQAERPGKFLAQAEKALDVIISSPSGFNLEDFGRSIIGALYFEAGNHEAAKTQLILASEKCHAKNAGQLLCGILLQLSIVYFHAGEDTKGEAVLRQAMKAASANRWFILCNMHAQTLTEACSRAIKAGIEDNYAKEWLEVLYGNEAASYFIAGLSTVNAADIADYCRQFIVGFKPLNESAARRVNICLMGKFLISVDGLEISPDIWKTKKIAGIFKYLVLNRGRLVSRDLLMELFWPESDKRSSSISLRSALYELRKVFTIYGLAADGPEAILIDKNGGLELTADSLVYVDADEFMSLYDKLALIPSDASGKASRMFIYENMVQLYRGSFAEDFPFEDQVLFRREQFKSIFLEAAFSLAEEYTEEKRYEKVENILLKVLDADAFNERACHLLMSLYISTSRKSLAAAFFSGFKTRMLEQLGIEPDKNLERLAGISI